MVIPEPELDLPGVLPRAPAEQQAAVGVTPLYPHAVVLQQLLALPEPLHLHGVLAVEGQLEHGVLPHLDDHGLTEHAQVLFGEPRGVCKETTVTMVWLQKVFITFSLMSGTSNLASDMHIY